jgi:Ca2+-binding EF-hand superfamily protein
MSVKHSLLFISLAALALGGTASAQDRDQTFRDRDTNNDGVLTQGEYGGHPGNFRSLDVNGDGVLSYEEFVRRGGRVTETDPPTFADPFAVMDRNNDGVISLGEWNGDRLSFRRMDRNGDGVLSRAEYNGQVSNKDPQVVAAWERFRALDRNGDDALSQRESGMGDAQFRSADYDRNGVLSVNEYTDAVVAPSGSDTFLSMDRNRDGVLTSWEWRGDRTIFDRLDRNNDRLVSRAEYAEYGGNQPVGLGTGNSVEQFRSLDRNRDGVLSRGESRMSSSEFNRADLNRDGVLTLKEFASGGESFDLLDRNNDGVISSWEWQGDRGAFDRLDRNNDRVLTRNEYDNQSVGFFGSILGRVEDRRFRDLDVNNDGVIRPSEWRGSMTDFDRMDLNRDGVITLSEFNR